MVFHKTWRCQHHQRNKTAGRYATGCPAKIDVKIKKVNCDTQRNDSFLKRSVPLPAVIKIFNAEHNHSTECADALRLLKSSRETRATFYGYFEDGMTAAEARQFHESRLLVKENGPLQLANSSLNPKKRTVGYWYDVWRKECFGKDLDPMVKLREKATLYAAQGGCILL